MADLDLQAFSLVDDASPVLVFSGRGVLGFHGISQYVRISGATGPVLPCPAELEVFEDTDVYLSYVEGGSNPNKDVIVLVRRKPAPSASLQIDCG